MSALHVDDVLRAIAKMAGEKEQLVGMLTRLHHDVFKHGIQEPLVICQGRDEPRVEAFQQLMRTLSETRTLLKTLEAGQ